MKKILIFLAAVTAAHAQQPDLLNSNQDLIGLNPSFAGSNGGLRNQASYNRQFVRYGGSPTTFANHVDVNLQHINAGMALSFVSETIGGISWSTYGLSFAQRIPVGDGKVIIVPSVRGALNDIKGNDGWLSSVSGSSPTGRDYKLFVSASSGILAMINNRIFVGGQVMNQNSPSSSRPGSFWRQNRYLAHASWNFTVRERHLLQLVGQYIWQGGFDYLSLAGNVMLNEIVLAGSAIRSDGSAFVNAGLRFRNFNVLLGYQMYSHKVMYADRWGIQASFGISKRGSRLSAFELM